MDKLFISWDKFHHDTCLLGQQLKALTKDWKIIVAITRGGLVPAGILSQILGIRRIETIGLSSYDDDTMSRDSLAVLKSFESERPDILVIDDLVETGLTLQTVTRMLPSATTACVYAKTKNPPQVDAFAQLLPLSAWVVFPWEVNAEN